MIARVADIAERMLLEESLEDYIGAAWHVLEPATPYLSNWHIGCICEYLEAVDAGQITRLIVNIPPRYMKSTIISIMWPTWTWVHNPSSRWLFASYSAELSTFHSVQRRHLIQSPWYQDNWHDRYELSADQNLKTEFQNTKRGHMIATSIGGTATGKGGNRIVIDDPHNPKRAASDAERETAVRDFDQTFYSRLDDKRRGAIVVVMQRLHEGDLTGHLLKEVGGYEHLCLPAIAEKKTTVSFPVTGREVEREEGDLLWPEREGQDEIDATKKALGTYGFVGQYQQAPSPPSGGILKREWWKFYTEPPPWFERKLSSWDCTFKDTDDSDYVVGQVWGVLGADRYLLDQTRDQMDFVATVAAVERMNAKWPGLNGHLIEDKANGPAVVSTMQRKIPGMIPINPEGGKIVRAYAAQPQIEAGNVFLPHPSAAPWVESLIDECAKFPNGDNDDQVDALTQFLNFCGDGAVTGAKTLDDYNVYPET